MSARRGGSGFGVNPLSYSEIQAFCELTGETYTEWELDTLAAMDNALLVEASRKSDKTKPAMQPATNEALRNLSKMMLARKKTKGQ